MVSWAAQVPLETMYTTTAKTSLFTNLCHVILQQKKDVRMLRFIQEVNTTTRSCALWDLEEETDYIVHVQSISMSGTSPLSEPLRFRTPKEAETQASKSKGRGAQRQNPNIQIWALAQPWNISTLRGKKTFQKSEYRGDLAFWQYLDWFCLKTKKNQ